MQDFSTKKRNITKSIVFLLILFILLYTVSGVVNYVAKKNDKIIQGRNKNITGIQKEEKNSIDVLVLGDSESYTSISTIDLWNNQGISSYIGGQSGQLIQETYYMLKIALQKQNPKLVILETNVLFRSQDKVKALDEYISQTGNYYFPVFRYHDIWKSIVLGNQYVDESYKGFVLRNRVKPYTRGDYMSRPSKKACISSNVQDYMDKIIDLCNKNKIPLLLMSAPSPVNYNNSKHNAIQEYANAKSLTYIDLNYKVDDIGINWSTDSLDKGDHLNLSGARKTTNYIGPLIKQQYNLTDHRNDSQYKNWNKDVSLYIKLMNKKMKQLEEKCRNHKR